MKRFCLFIFVGLLGTQYAWAGATNNISVGDSIYDEVEVLLSFGFMDDTLYGHRPWSEHEIARILKKAQEYVKKHPEASEKDRIEEIVSHISETISPIDQEESLQIKPVKSFSLFFTQLQSSSRDIPENNGVGHIDGFIHPMVENQNGIDFVRGQNILFQTEHALTSKYASLYFRPDFQLNLQSDGQSDASGTAQELYGKFNIGNFELQAGRDHLVWGQGKDGGFLLSDNARALDMIKISNDSPFVHPWYFNILGPSKYTFFVSNLGSDRAAFPYAYLYGLKFSFKPYHLLEIGIAETVMYGGDGGPATQWYDPLIELFPINKIGSNSHHTDISDHKFGFVDLRFTMPSFRNSALYFESFFDDSPARAIANFASDFWDETGLDFGLSVPRITSDGKLSGLIGFRHVPPWGYRHGTWKTGYTLNRELIGDSIGPDGDRLHADFRYELDPRRIVKIKLAYEQRSNNQYEQTVSPSGGYDEVIIKTPGIYERRCRAIADYSWEFFSKAEVKFQAGYEFVDNFGFSSATKNNFILGTGLKFQF